MGVFIICVNAGGGLPLLRRMIGENYEQTDHKKKNVSDYRHDLYVVRGYDGVNG